MRGAGERGIYYIVALGTLVFLLVTGATLFMQGMHQILQSERSGDRHAALHLAEAAVDEAISNLKSSVSADLPVTSLGAGTYWAEVETLGGGRYRITAHGVTNNDQANLEVVVGVSPLSVFQFALFGAQSVNVSGSAITDSYDSRQGSYASQVPGEGGDVGTNAVLPGGVTVSGGIAINGQIAVGPNVSPPESVVKGLENVLVTGEQKVVSQSAAFPMPAVTVPSTLTCNNFKVAGNTTITLSSATGTYCFDELTIEGGGTLTADGPVTVYLTGELHTSGNTVVGVSADPTTMQFLVASTGGATLEGTITGSAEFYGVLYGPQADITITGNAEVYGSVIANIVSLSGSAELHYDEAVSQLTEISNSSKAVILSWREL